MCFYILFTITIQVIKERYDELNSDIRKKVYTIAVSGRIDTLTAPSLEEKVREIENDADKLIIDMREVEYISSAGLRVIVAAHRTMLPKNGLVLRGLTKNVSTVINLTGFNKILNIEVSQ